MRKNHNRSDLWADWMRAMRAAIDLNPCILFVATQDHRLLSIAYDPIPHGLPAYHNDNRRPR